MRVELRDPARPFRAGSLELRDCAAIDLDPLEQVTLVTPSGGEYDVARMPWGFYATPSLNSRLRSFGLRAALARLSPKLSAPLVLRHVEGLSYDEISEVLGCSIGTVASRLSRSISRHRLSVMLSGSL